MSYLLGDSLDYGTGPYLVRINAGETSVLLSIPINDDDILEGNEEFHLSFNLSMLPSRVNVTNPEQATVIIMDDDGKYIIESLYVDKSVMVIVLYLNDFQKYFALLRNSRRETT